MAFKIILSILLVYLVQSALGTKVSDAPKLIGLVDELNNPEGTDTSIICSTGSGHLQSLSYEWFKDKEKLFATPGKIRIDSPQDNYHSVLRIFNLSPEDSGNYLCIAKNRFGQDKISTKLNVKVQLKWIHQPNNSTEVSVGKPLAIPCIGDGSPAPKVSWTKVAGQGTNENLEWSELSFASVKPKDSGIYECRLSNGFDEDLVAQIHINVRGK